MTDNASELDTPLLTPAVEEILIPRPELGEEKEQAGTAQIVLKCGDSFLITDVCGDLLASRQEMGLFRHGTRFLRTCNLYLAGKKLVSLSHQIGHTSDASHIDLTNQSFQAVHKENIPEGAIHIDRFLELEQDYLTETLTITNFHIIKIETTLSMQVGADFKDLFEVRGFPRAQHGTQLKPTTTPETIALRYHGLDNIERTTSVEIEKQAHGHIEGQRIDWQIALERGQMLQLRIKIKLSESSSEILETKPAVTLWRSSYHPHIETNDPLFNRFLKRGIQDLMMLSTMTAHGYYPYAGIPWFSCPFGRDGLIAALEFLPWYPMVARGTLEFLAAYQGKKIDTFTEEEPGRILHEFRSGEMANCREIPYIPYYGTIDATPLFIILMEAYIRWTDDRECLHKLWPNIQAAAQWMVTYGDKDGDTFLEYHRESSKGLANQGWKDSYDAINHQDGRLANAPIALCEVQGFAYAAYRATAYLAQSMGKEDESKQWNQRADEIQSNFLRSYWWEKEQIFYQALADEKEPCAVVSSNAGQCLWSGIVPEELAQPLIRRLMQKDMQSGWGIRTLSTQAQLYNPMSYHNGSVWPHDTAIIGAGMALYGAKEEACQMLKSLYDASNYFADARLPELYCGFEKRDGYGPTRYPVSCSPQAWAAGTPFMLLNALLGLNPNAAEHRLTLHHPTLPSWFHCLEVKGIYVGSRRVHLKLVRNGPDTEVILGKENEIDIRIL